MSTSKNRFTSYGPNMTVDLGRREPTGKPQYHSYGPNMTVDLGRREPTGTPVATFPPGHISRLLSDGTLQVYQGEPGGGITDSRPSKLRDALARITPKSGDNQAYNALERAAAGEKLASINQRNRNRYDQDHPWGKEKP